ncbi:hypothetical protein QSE00_23005 [Arenibacter sp. M-2]|uniref:hypothetical protein n=1 Tax=Arenibacter sp. M-2 TaxID=3053612 RepID=UPI00257039D8|nr:hypothetical protein [Arenibacter sp. M-2]MDL5514698.1 hypothetical protein [Arenibacter sp. M-2]
MNIYIDIQKTRSTDWANAPCYGGTYMNFNELPKMGDIIEHLNIIPQFAKKHPDLNNVPEGSFEVICEPFEINSKNPFNCSHKIIVCSTEV